MIEEIFKIGKTTKELSQKAEALAKETFEKIEATCLYNQAKVLRAFSDNRVGAQHLCGTTGYGYDDIGRDTLDKVYAQSFECEDALVRHTIVSGTHALSTALFAVLRPGDTLLAVTGKPYDTLDGVIGIGRRENGCLAEFGVNYAQIDLVSGKIDFDGVRDYLSENKVKMAHIQRSRGYDWRPSVTTEDLARLIELIKKESPDTVVFVDNCYGEFVEMHEPTYYGADLMAGSLIKNPGGGIVRTGGYVAGRHDLVELCGYRHTTPSLGRETGASIDMNRELYQGFFLAPHTVSQCLKAAVFASAALELAGFDVSPRYNDHRSDIVQAVRFYDKDKLISFCQGIQAGAPIDSYVTPMPWDMPGYDDQVIMAAGAFIQGASIELSADGPMREPFAAFMQGGLTYESAKIGIMCAIDKLVGDKNE